MAIKINADTVIFDDRVFCLGSGPTGSRPVSPLRGMIWYNTTLGYFEGYNGTAWAALGGGISDGDKGDITVSNTGTTWTIDNGVVTTAKLATLTPGVVISGTSTGDALRITQLGTGNALVVEDETNPDATRFAVTANGDVGIGVDPYNFAGYTTVRVGNSTSGSLVDFVLNDITNGRILTTSSYFVVESFNQPLVFRTRPGNDLQTVQERFRIEEVNGAWGLAGTNYGTAGQVIASNGSTSAPTWQNISVDNLSDVVITTPATNQVLSYNGTNWVNTAASGAVGFTGSAGGTTDEYARTISYLGL